MIVLEKEQIASDNKLDKPVEIKQADQEEKDDESGMTRREIIAKWKNVLQVLEVPTKTNRDEDLRLVSWLS